MLRRIRWLADQPGQRLRLRRNGPHSRRLLPRQREPSQIGSAPWTGVKRLPLMPTMPAAVPDWRRIVRSVRPMATSRRPNRRLCRGQSQVRESYNRPWPGIKVRVTSRKLAGLSLSERWQDEADGKTEGSPSSYPAPSLLPLRRDEGFRLSARSRCALQVRVTHAEARLAPPAGHAESIEYAIHHRTDRRASREPRVRAHFSGSYRRRCRARVRWAILDHWQQHNAHAVRFAKVHKNPELPIFDDDTFDDLADAITLTKGTAVIVERQIGHWVVLQEAPIFNSADFEPGFGTCLGASFLREGARDCTDLDQCGRSTDTNDSRHFPNRSLT